MTTIRVTSAWIVFACLMAGMSAANAQTANVVSDAFTGKAATNPWVPFGAACMTAGDGSGTIPSCTAITDSPGSGALRLTYAQGNQSGAIISNPNMAFSSSQGLQVTFTTYTYGGDSGGTGKDGADGIGFYLLNGTQTPNIGAFGGSLGYSCSNSNNPHDGMAGAYLGLGMDEYGNFLNSADNTATGDPATNSNGGNGQFYQPGRIGLRGYGNVNTANLQTLAPAGYTVQESDVKVTCQTGQFSYVVTPASTTSATTYAYTYSYMTGNGQNQNTNTYSGTLYTQVTSHHNTSYAAAGSTVSGPTSTNNDGYTGTDNSPYGKVSNTFYPIAITTTPTTTTTTIPAVMSTPIAVPDYAIIPNGYLNLPSGSPIANEGTSSRTIATPINYKLQITQDGKLSFWYSYNGGTYNTVLANQSISASNGTMPSSFLFGFGASTGGSNNVHEITCFLATPANVSASSAGLNVQQAGEVKTTTQVYLAYYHPTNWWGELDSQTLVVTGNTVTISPVANWDASCVLTGGTCTATTSSTATTPNTGTAQASRTLLTSSGAASSPGINFSTTGFPAGDTTAFATLTKTEQGWLEAGTTTGDTGGALLLAYLSGDRNNEVPITGPLAPQIYRARTSVLADIIDSSPTWVGAPSAPYTATWADKLYPAATIPENALGAATYPGFMTADAPRLNVVYDGANDGFLHAFETGANDNPDGSYDSASNDGKELFAYMPQAVLSSIHNGTTAALDYSSPNYAHNYFVDATPGTGDLFYNNAWHTWLVGGLGAGGNAIYAIDITNPGTAFTASNVIGEWGSTGTSTNPATGLPAATGTNPLTCTNNASCAANLGQTYGTPQIRRLHNSEWGVIFGNGFNSSTGHAGIYVMTFLSTTGALDKVYYLDTGVAGTVAKPDGIAYVTPTDLDGDHITDYVYAGDYYGNVWRFDLTSNLPANWGVTDYSTATIPGTSSTPKPLFTTPTATTCTVTTKPCPTGKSVTNGQPITTSVVALSVAPSANGTPRIMVEFGTGAVTPQTTTAAIQYAYGQQSLYGIWDWKVGQSGTVGAPFNGLTGSTAPTAGFTTSALQQQSVTATTNSTSDGTVQGYRTISNASICFVGTTCSSGSGSVAGTQYGWYMNLPGFSTTVTGVDGTTGTTGNNQTEQVIYSPVELEGAFTVNTTIPANNAPLACSVQNAQGWTMALNPATGGLFNQSFFDDASGQPVTLNGTPVSGIAINATGSPSVVTANGKPYLVSQTVNGTGTVNQINPPPGNNGGRLTWIELH
ncbi:MAG: PilC/PilY family type IV pilus protein [Rhodanobacter sp.]